MCWIEKCTKTFRCGAMPGGLISMPDIPAISTRKEKICPIHTSALRGYQYAVASQGVNVPFEVWAAHHHVEYCTNKRVYQATWETERPCRTGRNGENACLSWGTGHLYQHAPGGAPITPGSWPLVCFYPRVLSSRPTVAVPSLNLCRELDGSSTRMSICIALNDSADRLIGATDGIH